MTFKKKRSVGLSHLLSEPMLFFVQAMLCLNIQLSVFKTCTNQDWPFHRILKKRQKVCCFHSLRTVSSSFAIIILTWGRFVSEPLPSISESRISRVITKLRIAFKLFSTPVGGLSSVLCTETQNISFDCLNVHIDCTVNWVPTLHSGINLRVFKTSFKLILSI